MVEVYRQVEQMRAGTHTQAEQAETHANGINGTETEEKNNILSSTPHPKQIKKNFFENKMSVQLSPITLGNYKTMVSKRRSKDVGVRPRTSRSLDNLDPQRENNRSQDSASLVGFSESSQSMAPRTSRRDKLPNRTMTRADKSEQRVEFKQSSKSKDSVHDRTRSKTPKLIDTKVQASKFTLSRPKSPKLKNVKKQHEYLPAAEIAANSMLQLKTHSHVATPLIEKIRKLHANDFGPIHQDKNRIFEHHLKTNPSSSGNGMGFTEFPKFDNGPNIFDGVQQGDAIQELPKFSDSNDLFSNANEPGRLSHDMELSRYSTARILTARISTHQPIDEQLSEDEIDDPTTSAKNTRAQSEHLWPEDRHEESGADDEDDDSTHLYTNIIEDSQNDSLPDLPEELLQPLRSNIVILNKTSDPNWSDTSIAKDLLLDESRRNWSGPEESRHSCRCKTGCRTARCGCRKKNCSCNVMCNCNGSHCENYMY